MVVFTLGLFTCRFSSADVTFTVTPTAVSNTYPGVLTLLISGLTNGETVVVQRYLDANANGMIDQGDWLVQQLPLSDGKASVIAGVTNLNVPGDLNPTGGTITVQLSLQSSGIEQRYIGSYAFRLSSPGGRFVPITNLFAVTNTAFDQSFTGRVVCSGTNVPYATVMLAAPGGKGGPVAGVVADGLGAYTIKAAPGAYTLFAARNDYLGLFTAPLLTLNPGTAMTTNVSLLPATTSICGRFVDADNPSQGIPGLLVVAQTSDNSLLGVGYTDPNGFFTTAVSANQWKLSSDSDQYPSSGYLALQNRLAVDTSAGSVTGALVALPKGTALFYGSVKDEQNHPLPGIKVYADDTANQYEGAGTTDQNGNYVAAARGGAWRVGPSSSSSGYTNYIFPQYINTNIANGQAIEVDFMALYAPNRITGYLRDAATGNGIPNVGVNAWPAGGGNLNSHAKTDSSGFYSLSVANGTWRVAVNCLCSYSDCLSSSYQCPANNNQSVVISNNDAALDFTVGQAPSQISGYIRNNSGNPLANVGVYVYQSGNSGNKPATTTDGSGHYLFNVANGDWNVGVFCCGNQALSPLGYLCVGEQSTSVSNSPNVVNFTVSPAPRQIIGHLRDDSGNPIPNVNVNAWNGSYSTCATTDSSGFYAPASSDHYPSQWASQRVLRCLPAGLKLLS